MKSESTKSEKSLKYFHRTLGFRFSSSEVERVERRSAEGGRRKSHSVFPVHVRFLILEFRG